MSLSLQKAVVCPYVDLEALSKVKHSNVLHVQTLVSFKRGLGTGWFREKESHGMMSNKKIDIDYKIYIEIKRFHTYKSFTVLSWHKREQFQQSLSKSLRFFTVHPRNIPLSCRCRPKVRPDQRSGVTSATTWNYSGWFVSTCRPCRLMRGWWHRRIQTSE